MSAEASPTAAPPLGRLITLSIPSVEELSAKVVGGGDGFTQLKLATRPRTDMDLLLRSQVFLEFVTDDGMWRTLGTVALVGSDVLRFEHRGRVQLLQRRAHVRTDLIAQLVVTPEGGKPRRCLTLNVSGGGALVRGLDDVALDGDLSFDLHLDLLPARIQGTCKVVRRTPDGCHGIQFTEIEEGDRDKLVRFAYTRENAARQARLGY
jgi:hypothetical protein